MKRNRMKAVVCIAAILVAVALAVGGLRYLEHLHHRLEWERNQKLIAEVTARHVIPQQLEHPRERERNLKRSQRDATEMHLELPRLREHNLKWLCLSRAHTALTEGEGADETLRCLKEAESRGPNLPGPLAVQGTVHLWRGEREIALEYYRRALVLLEEKTEETASFYEEGHYSRIFTANQEDLEEWTGDLERVLAEEGSKE